MRDFSGHHSRKGPHGREMVGPRSDPTAREAISNADSGTGEYTSGEAFRDLMKICKRHSKKTLGADTLVVKAAMRLYRVVEDEREARG